MPEISGLLLLLLFFGFNLLRKKVQQEASKAKSPPKTQTYQPSEMPAFPEAAPAMPVRQMSIDKARTVQKKAVPVTPKSTAEGEAMEWKPEKLDSNPPSSYVDPKTQNRVVPVLTKNSIIQGIVLHEILTRPKHAVAPYLKDYPPRV